MLGLPSLSHPGVGFSDGLGAGPLLRESQAVQDALAAAAAAQGHLLGGLGTNPTQAICPA